jgi:hypothetical protein
MDEITHTLALAKRGGKFTRAELFEKMNALAREHHLGPGMSTSQAFCKFVQTPEGRELLAIQMRMDGRDVEPELPMVKSGSEDPWDRLIRLTKAAAGCTESQAVDAALSTEGGRYAFAKRKRADRIGTGQFSHADMDAIAGEQELTLEMRKRGSRSAYEDMFDEIKRAHPQLTDSQVHDFARQKNPEAWAEHKKLNKLGHMSSVLPQSHGQHERSGEEPPTPTTGRSGRTPPQWRSEHSGSPPTTPEHEPERPSDNPVIKYLAERIPLDRAVWYYNKFPDNVKQALGTLFR